MRGEYRRDARALEPLQQRRRVDAGVARAVERIGEAARPARRAGVGVRAAAAMLLLVLGDVEKVREIAEGANQLQGLVQVEGVQLALELRTAAFFPVEAHRGLADAFDALERGVARLAADHLAEQAPEQAPVLAQQGFLFLGRAMRGRHDRWERIIRIP